MNTAKKIAAVLIAAIVCAGCILNAEALYSPHGHSDGKIQDILRTVMDAAADSDAIHIGCFWSMEEIFDARALADDRSAFEQALNEVNRRELPAIRAAMPQGLRNAQGTRVTPEASISWLGNHNYIFDCYYFETWAQKEQIEQLAALDRIEKIDYQGYDARWSRFERIDEEVATVMRFAPEETFDLAVWLTYYNEDPFDEASWPRTKAELEKYGTNELEAMIAARTDALKKYHLEHSEAFLASLPADLRAAVDVTRIDEYAPVINLYADRETIERLAACEDVEMIYLGDSYHFYVSMEESEKIPDDGDLNCDGKVNSADARTALRAAAQIEDLTRVQAYLGDMNESGKVDAADARTILRIAAKLEQAE